MASARRTLCRTAINTAANDRGIHDGDGNRTAAQSHGAGGRLPRPCGLWQRGAGGHPTERGVQFVTWEWDWDREGVHHGHYFQNGYEEAKHDFVRRSGLLPREALFEPEQLAEMHRALAFVCEQDEGLSIGREKGDQGHHGAAQVPVAGAFGADADNGTKYVSGVDHSMPLFL